MALICGGAAAWELRSGAMGQCGAWRPRSRPPSSERTANVAQAKRSVRNVRARCRTRKDLACASKPGDRRACAPAAATQVATLAPTVTQRCVSSAAQRRVHCTLREEKWETSAPHADSESGRLVDTLSTRECVAAFKIPELCRASFVSLQRACVCVLLCRASLLRKAMRHLPCALTAAWRCRVHTRSLTLALRAYTCVLRLGRCASARATSRGAHSAPVVRA